MGRPAPRLPRHALPHARAARSPAGTAGHAALPHVPQRRHRREGPLLQRRRRRPATRHDEPRGRRTSTATRRPGRRDLRLLAGRRCRRASAPDNLWYRFIVTDGTDTDYYADNTAALDGGLGAASDDPVDNSWALMVYEPGFRRPSWAKDAVIYQIFPDRFRNGRKDNDPKTGDVRYDDPVLELRLGHAARGLLPQLRRRQHQLPVALRRHAARRQPDQGAAARPRLLRRRPQGRRPEARLPARPWASTRSTSTRSSTPGRTTRYDTQDYKQIDPYFGTQKDWENLVKHANEPRHAHHPRRRVQPPLVRQPVLRPLPPLLDGRRVRVGDLAVPRLVRLPRGRGRAPAPAPAPAARHSADYDGWFGFDSIPVINKAASNTASGATS